MQVYGGLKIQLNIPLNVGRTVSGILWTENWMSLRDRLDAFADIKTPSLEDSNPITLLPDP